MQSDSFTDRLATKILWGMVVGIIAGLAARGLGILWPNLLESIQWFSTDFLDPFGQIFLRLLFLVVVPLVFSSLALGIAQLGRLNRLGPLAGKTFALFFLNMAIGVALGLVMMNLLTPGSRMDNDVRDELLSQYAPQVEATRDRANQQPSYNLQFLVDIFLPRNILRAVVDFQILPLIVFALLVGSAGTMALENHRLRLISGLELTVELMTKMVYIALRLAPYAVPVMIFVVVVKSGFSFLQSLAFFVLGVVAVMLLHLFVVMPLLLRLWTRQSPRVFFKAVRTIIVTAFSTSSSSATLPTTLHVTREKLGVSPATAGFVLPLGATMNMSGTALYEGCVVLFIAQVYGVDLLLSQQLMLLLLAVMSSVAVAGIPGASLPVIMGLLTQFGVPAEGIALILGTDRLLDMGRTVVNVTADVVTACIVDESLKPKAKSWS